MIGTFYLMMGNVAGQLVNVVGLLFLSRIYDPASVGLWALFLGIGFAVQFLAGLHYDLALVMVDDDRDAAHLTLLAIGVSTVMAVLFVIGLKLFLLMGLPWVPDAVAAFSWTFLPYIICYGIYNAGTAWGIRKQRYRWLMVTRVSVPLFTLILQFLFRDNEMVGNGLILGTIVTYAIIALWCAGFLFKPLKELLAGHMQNGFRTMRALARRESGFPTLSIPRALIVSFANQAVVVLLGLFYSLPVVGAFNLAYRALYAPMLLIGGALAQAIMPSLSQSRATIKNLESQLTSIVRILGWIYIPALLFIVIYGPHVFVFVFGEQWGQAGRYAGYLTMAMFGTALTMWFEKIFDILHRQKLHLVLGTALNAGALLAFVGAHYIWRDADMMILCWSAAMLVYAGIWLAVAFRICGFALPRLLGIGLEFACLAAFLLFVLPYALAPAEYAAKVMGIVIVFAAYGFAAWLRLRGDIGFFLGQLLRQR